MAGPLLELAKTWPQMKKDVLITGHPDTISVEVKEDLNLTIEKLNRKSLISRLLVWLCNTCNKQYVFAKKDDALLISILGLCLVINFI